MSVFGQQSQTLTEMAKQLGHSDHLLKAQYRGSAAMDSSITAESWLPGTTGVHCNVTHGDQSEVVKGDMTQQFHGKKDSTYHGEVNETHNGDVTVQSYGTVTKNYFGNRSDVSLLQTTFYDNSVNWLYQEGFQSGVFSMNSYDLGIYLYGVYAQLQGLNLNVTLTLDIDFSAKEINLRELIFKAKGQEVDVKALAEDVAFLKDHIAITRARANAVVADVRPFKATLGTADIGTPAHVAAVHIPI